MSPLARNNSSVGQDCNQVFRPIELEAPFSNGQILFLLEIFIELRIHRRELTECANPRKCVARSGREEEICNTISYSTSGTTSCNSFGSNCRKVILHIDIKTKQIKSEFKSSH